MAIVFNEQWSLVSPQVNAFMGVTASALLPRLFMSSVVRVVSMVGLFVTAVLAGLVESA
ncbi:hypothetical protein [Mesorhizobium sp.]|uniref:hypothetical protein n=1 Tax=Mesorhizobium sp. TaxID=1871066 RepID=UPI00257CBECD|nr:hypothetical protein [Mesorhizobium sp.]